MVRFHLCLLSVLAMLVSAQAASAHFLWLVLEPTAAPTKAKVFFGEAAEPDDPALLDRVATAEAWAVGGRGEPQPLTFKKSNDALEAELSGLSQRSSVVLRHTYGVVTRGGETFLLKYYAKAYPSPLPGTWQSVNDKERLPLEIVPSMDGAATILKIQWKGGPAPGATVTIVGPGIAEKQEGTTDEQGTYRCQLPTTGMYSIRARFIESSSGSHEGKTYQSIRHYSTLALRHMPSRLAPVSHSLPKLPQGITSFGGAIVGDVLYLYGGNYGSAHDFYNEGQSGDLWKLNQNDPQKWERYGDGPKLQGLAMVAYKGELFRVGGFTAKNKEGEDQDLNSQTDCARLIPEKQSWESLTHLPVGRSSHDAAVIGDTLYVVGGWNLGGKGNEPVWHETALALNLAKEPFVWRTIAAPPFKRRALAVAEWQGKLFCIGGMQEKGDTTTAVAVYDPPTDSWSDGPSLLGTGMDGFGASAFSTAGGLYVSTMSGSIQRLSGGGKEWEYLGQLAHPRFFHRLLPRQDGRLVVVGGAHMSVGKVEELELIEGK